MNSERSCDPQFCRVHWNPARSEKVTRAVLRTHPEDRRIRLPEVTANGQDVLHEIAASVLGEATAPVRRVRPEILERLPAHEDMRDLTAEDYDDMLRQEGNP